MNREAPWTGWWGHALAPAPQELSNPFPAPMPDQRWLNAPWEPSAVLRAPSVQGGLSASLSCTSSPLGLPQTLGLVSSAQGTHSALLGVPAPWPENSPDMKLCPPHCFPASQGSLSLIGWCPVARNPKGGTSGSTQALVEVPTGLGCAVQTEPLVSVVEYPPN